MIASCFFCAKFLPLKAGDVQGGESDIYSYFRSQNCIHLLTSKMYTVRVVRRVLSASFQIRPTLAFCNRTPHQSPKESEQTESLPSKWGVMGVDEMGNCWELSLLHPQLTVNKIVRSECWLRPGLRESVVVWSWVSWANGPHLHFKQIYTDVTGWIAHCSLPTHFPAFSVSGKNLTQREEKKEGVIRNPVWAVFRSQSGNWCIVVSEVDGPEPDGHLDLHILLRSQSFTPSPLCFVMQEREKEKRPNWSASRPHTEQLFFSRSFVRKEEIKPNVAEVFTTEVCEHRARIFLLPGRDALSSKSS